MVSRRDVDEQLKELGLRFRRFGRAEIRELSNILMPGEQIQHCLNGFYQGAIGLLCATDRRLLLIDKRPLFLNLEDIRYEMIAQIDYSARAIDSTVIVITATKTLGFRSFREKRLRALCNFVQEQVMVARQSPNMVQTMQLPSLTSSTVMRLHESLYRRRRPSKFYPNISQTQLNR